MNNSDVIIQSQNPTEKAIVAVGASEDSEPDRSAVPADKPSNKIITRIYALRHQSALLRETESAAAVMARHGGTGPGFDTLRIMIALMIMGFHGSQILHGRVAADLRHSDLFPMTLALVPLFFCLSGFLVTGSAIRTRSIKKFLTNRGLRIFPALTVEVFLCALLLGPLLTDLDLKSYFSEIKFYSYFGNIIGRVRMSLPGVFSSNPIPDTVNASLWTLQPEFYCYLLMTLMMYTTLAFRKEIMLWGFITTTVILSLMNLAYDFGQPTDVFPPHVIIFYFFAGIVAYHWKDKIPLNGLLFLTALGVAYYSITAPSLAYLSAIPVTYVMVYLGLLDIPLIKPFSNGDYSYGIYLFNFPIQQSIVKLYPDIDSWWLLMVISIPATMVFSAFSWHYIEKPALALKHRSWTTNSSYLWLGNLLRPPSKN